MTTLCRYLSLLVSWIASGVKPSALPQPTFAMSKFCGIVLGGIVFGGIVFGGFSALAHAQTPDLPRTEYYVARDLYDAGNLSEATQGFRVAVNRGQQIKGQRWVDAIPPLVMLGECYYRQGAIAQSLEQYDAALLTALAFPTWADAIRAPEQMPELTLDATALSWTKLSRPTRLLRVPSIVQVAVDPAAARFNGDGQLVPGGSQIVRLDVPEVLRCLAVALHRRAQLLGPLAAYSPLSQPAVDWLAKTPERSRPWLQTAWRALHGLAMLSIDQVQSEALLTAAVSIDAKQDYFLSPICLTTLARLEMNRGISPLLLNRLGDASLRAAQLEQAGGLADALALTGQVACAGRRTELLPVLQSATLWSKNLSVLPYMHGSAAVCELAVIAGNLGLHESTAIQVLAILRGQDRERDSVTLPRVQAQLGYAMARAAAAQNFLPLADSHLEKSLSLLRGSPTTGAAVPHVFQIQLTLELMNNKALQPVEAERIFAQLLAEPSRQQWALNPLECLVTISTPHRTSCEMAIQLAIQQGSADQAVARMAAHQWQRFHELLPLGGRLLAARYWMSQDKQSWPTEMATNLEPALSATPAAYTLPRSITESVASLSRAGAVTDDKQLSPEAKKKWQDVARQSELAENALMNLALERLPIARTLVAVHSASQMQASLKDHDLLLGFVHTPTQIFGTAISKQSIETWEVPDSPAVDAKIALLLVRLGLTSAPTLETTPQAAWKTSAGELSKLLLPESVRQMVARSERLVIVPSGNLWYLPFELLPNDTGGAAWLARHPICYLPTLSHVDAVGAAAPKIESTAGIFNTFFLVDRVANQTLCSGIAQEQKRSVRIDLNQKPMLSAPSWLRLTASQIWVAAELPMAGTAWELKVLPMEPSRENALASWLQSPLRAPARLYLPGLQSSAAAAQMNGGNELFLPACVFMTAGVKSTWMSRWKVGGRSSLLALSRLLEEVEYESPSAAWQRAAISLWAEKLPTSDEPILPRAKALPPTLEGANPLLWASYMTLGDHAAAE